MRPNLLEKRRYPENVAMSTDTNLIGQSNGKKVGLSVAVAMHPLFLRRLRRRIAGSRWCAKFAAYYSTAQETETG